jgi:tRNA1(Val) A37 N6-methylase TrmN6
LLVHRGQFALIQRAAALPEVLAALAGRFGDARIRPVHPFAEAPAHRVLLVATKGSRGSVTLLPSFVLHEADGRWTPRADAVLRGSQHIEM